MTILLTVIIAILVMLLLQFIILKISLPYAKETIKKAIDVSCYINTYHYSKDEINRIRIGRERYYEALFGDKVTEFKKDKTDYIFWIFYTQVFNKLLNCIPIDITMYNNRCLSEGELRKTELYLDDYLENQEKEYKKYATEIEIENREAIKNVENEATENN